MIKIKSQSIPYFASEIVYSNYIDYLEDEKIETLTNSNFNIDFGQFNKDEVQKSIIENCKQYEAKDIDSFVHNDNLYIIKDVSKITLIEGLLALNFIKEFSKKKYIEKGVGTFAMRLYLIASLTRKVVNGKVEKLPNDFGLVYDFIENRVNELQDISLKNAIDFDVFFWRFNEKLSNPLYSKSMESIHPTNHKATDKSEYERQKRWSDYFGSITIYYTLLSGQIIPNDLDSLELPFFHSIFLYALHSNK